MKRIIAASAFLLLGSSTAFAGIYPPRPIVKTQSTPIGSAPVWLGELGHLVYFIASPAAGGLALYATDGTTAGTTKIAPMDGLAVLVPDVGPLFISAGTKAYFQGSTSADGQETWVTDGTTAGTHEIENIYPGGIVYMPAFLGLSGTDLIFAENTGDSSMQLFRTDGTVAGTHALSNFADNQYGALTESAMINGKFYVALESRLSCCTPDLWVTDGTASGTVQIDSNEGSPFHLQPSSLRPFGNSLALFTTTENDGTELSFVDSATNALSILDLVPGSGPGAASGSTIAVMDGFVLYLRGDVNDGLQVWRSDGTVPGTAMVKDTSTGVVQVSELGQNVAMTRVGNYALFQAQNTQIGTQLWSSDGTAQGTVPLIATPTHGGFFPPLISVVGSHAYYMVWTGSAFQVVVTDGTVAGTHVLADAGTIDANAITETQVVGDDNLTYIYTYHRDSTDPTTNTKHLYAYAPQTNVVTHLLDNALFDATEPPLAFNGRLYFKGYDTAHSDQPWISDGTVAGTHILINLLDSPPTAGDDSASSANDAPVTINVLANDTDSDGTIDPTSVQVASQPAHGNVSVGASGSLVYTPVSGFAGSDSFTYSERDNEGVASNIATVTVTVTAAAAPSMGGGKSGGGAVGVMELLALTLLLCFRGRVVAEIKRL
jgi:ELWxxDGT repeat protein